ncbi:hypothetical protein LCX93_00505 [Sulfurimonas sp. SWIR-19]|uniref:hypothetical protein n=1 Tax=Sulfurimonas sp. SWIR-19 TaxID=2878390 RepID=UPI001CF49296|nr:hypothetical protein [Sulfurimonas sp. SWIR-19]UCN00428.1 hypothetical protein LCX93_00505 [Sulfurimonas sp. SWIR-19]
METGISVLIGVIATYFFAKYYFEKSINKSLTPYIDFTSSILSNIDDDVKKVLDIKYKGMKVDNLTEIQLLVANTGDIAIRDLIHPLEVQLPNSISIIDVVILYIYPEGREVNLKLEENKIILNFDLLNQKDFFVVKFLFDGKLRVSDFKFKIVVDDLPPIITAKRMPYDLIEEEAKETKKSSFDYGEIISGIVLLTIGFSLFYTAYSSNLNFPDIHIKTFFEDIEKINIDDLQLGIFTKWISYLMGIALSFASLALLFGFIEKINPFRDKNTFVLPKEIYKSKSLLLKQDNIIEDNKTE